MLAVPGDSLGSGELEQASVHPSHAGIQGSEAKSKSFPLAPK